MCTAHFDSMFVCEEQFKGLVEIGTDLTTTLFSRLADTVYKFVKVLNLMLTLAMLPTDFLQAIVNPTERERDPISKQNDIHKISLASLMFATSSSSCSK